MNNYKKKRILAAVTDLLLVLLIDFIAFLVLKITAENYLIILIPIMLFVHILYFTLFPLLPMNGTPGLYFQKLIIRRENGENASAGSLLLRAFTSFFSNLLLGFGFWYCLFDGREATIYDYASGTVVDDIGSNNGNKAFLQSVGKTMPNSKYEIKSEGLIIGRNPNTCNVVLPSDEPCVSRIHCRVVFNAQTKMLLIKDMGSSYGTFLSTGEKLDSGRVAAIADGGYFYLGTKNVTFRFYIEN